MPSILDFNNLGVSSGTGTNPDINSQTLASSFANSSWTPPTEGMIVVWVWSYDNLVGLANATMSGNSLTWTRIQEFRISDNGSGLLTLFAAKATGATAGVTTIDFAGRSQDRCQASFSQVLNVKMTSDLHETFVYYNYFSLYDGSQTSGSTGINPPVAPQNGFMSCWVHAQGEATTPRSGWTALDDLYTGSDTGVAVHVLDKNNSDTLSTASWSTSVGWAVACVEIKAGPFSSRMPPRPRMGIGL